MASRSGLRKVKWYSLMISETVSGFSPSSSQSEPHRIYRRPQLVRSRVYDKQDDEQILP